jgi:hypothetical protein
MEASRETLFVFRQGKAGTETAGSGSGNKIKSMGFAVPAGKSCIHSDESKRFVRQVLNGGEWQERVLEQGFYPAFKRQPGRYREGNNASAVKDMEAVWEKVEEWKQQGAIMQLQEPAWCPSPLQEPAWCPSPLQEPAWCTSPLSVAVKWDTQAGKFKKRVVLDLSRHVNLHTEQYTLAYLPPQSADVRELRCHSNDDSAPPSLPNREVLAAAHVSLCCAPDYSLLIFRYLNRFFLLIGIITIVIYYV